MSSTATIHPDDAELIEQLARLQQMHKKLQDLRSLLPTALLGPARQAISDPTSIGPRKVGMQLAKTAKAGQADITIFKKEWYDDRSRQLFRDAKAANETQGHDAWFEDYVALAKANKQPSAGKSGSAQFESIQEGELSVEKWSSLERKIKVTKAEGESTFPVHVEVEGVHFGIQRNEDDQRYELETRDQQQISKLVLEQIQKSGPWRGIGDLMEILEAYDGFKIRLCDGCGKLLDSNMDYALVRVVTQGSPQNGANQSSQEWMAYHEGCPVTLLEGSPTKSAHRE